MPPEKRIDLRPRRVSDADALFPTMSHPESMRFWSRAPFTDIEELRKYFAPEDTSGWKCWAIVKAGEDEAIGFVAACEKRKGVSEIGYLIAREAQGHGYGREAVGLLIERFFAEGQRRIVADVDPENQPSIALLTALGFKLEGHLRAEWETHIGIRDSKIYGLLTGEWQPRTAT
ncbi:putative acetyltransferase [Aureobasidium sp. EXF-10727]|nr:putative acetyltransferase [Aureobasidium sp. EXF-10727]